jgi:hypothetical protein
MARVRKSFAITIAAPFALAPTPAAADEVIYLRCGRSAGANTNTPAYFGPAAGPSANLDVVVLGGKQCASKLTGYTVVQVNRHAGAIEIARAVGARSQITNPPSMPERRF